jgi:hypothetical protein
VPQIRHAHHPLRIQYQRLIPLCKVIFDVGTSIVGSLRKKRLHVYKSKRWILDFVTMAFSLFPCRIFRFHSLFGRNKVSLQFMLRSAHPHEAIGGDQPSEWVFLVQTPCYAVGRENLDLILVMAMIIARGSLSKSYTSEMALDGEPGLRMQHGIVIVHFIS